MKLTTTETSNRLDIDSILAIAEMFRENISIPEGEKWGVSKESFCPFSTILQDKEALWKKENGLLEKFPPKIFHNPPIICWMPDYELINNKAYIKFSPDNYATTWQPILLGIYFSQRRIFCWDKNERIWAEFKFENPDSTDKAFSSFLHSWIWYNFQF